MRNSVFKSPSLKSIVTTVILFSASLSNAAYECKELFLTQPARLTGATEISQIGTATWNRQAVRVLGKLSMPTPQSLTTNDKILLQSFGIRNEDLKGKDWPTLKHFIFAMINRNAVRNPDLELALKNYQHQLLGNLVALAPIPSPLPLPGSRAESGYGRMDTGFGVLLLPTNDKAYQNPEYLRRVIGNRGATSTGYTRHDPQQSFDFFSRQFKRLSEGKNHEVKPVAFTQGASDAAALLVDVSNWIVSLRNKNRMNGRIMVLDETYVAARGPLRSLRWFDRSDTGPQMHASNTPWKNEVVPYRAGMSKIEESPLTERVDIRQLQWIEEQFKKGDVGVFIVEPIAASAYVKFHKPEFLRRLRALADQYGVAIVADEAFGAGGRTGLPFSYMHYDGFVPDFVIFGKGTVVAGLAEVVRKNNGNPFLIENLESQIENQRDLFNLSETGPRFKLFDPTINGWSDIFLKSAVTLERILDDRLMENAATMGELLKKEVQWLVHVLGSRNFSPATTFVKKFLTSNLSLKERNQIFKDVLTNEPVDVRSLGLMIGFTTDTGHLRLTPPITLSAEQIDGFVKQVILDTLSSADEKNYQGVHLKDIEQLRNLDLESMKQKALEMRFKYYENFQLRPNVVGRSTAVK